MKKSIFYSSLIMLFMLAMSLPISTVFGAADIKDMIGTRIPNGTKVAVSSSTTSDIGSNAIDGDLSKWWNSGKSSGTIELNFTHAIDFNAVQIATGAQPANNETYTLYGLKNGTWSQIGKDTKFVTQEILLLDPISVTPGTYDGLRIVISSATSWVVINEISVGSTVIIPQHLTVAPVDQAANLKWDATSDAESYIIRYGTQSGDYTQTIPVSKDAYTNFKVTSLNNGTTYYFVVSAVVNGVESNLSNEATATINKQTVPTIPDEPESDERAILTIIMDNGLEKEFDLNMTEVNSFISWYEEKGNGIGKAIYAIDKHSNNKGPFVSRKDYIVFDKILSFEVSSYNNNN